MYSPDMQNRDKASIEREAEILTSKELTRALERKDREDFAIFQQGEIALDSAAYNGDESDNIQANGRIIGNNRARNNKYLNGHQEKDSYGIKALIGALEAIGVAQAVLVEWARGIGATLTPSGSGMTSAFKAKSNFKDVVYDENFIYGGEEVSTRTAELFTKRLERIIELQKKLQLVKDPVQRAEIKDQFTRLVERSNVAFHPGVGWAFASEKVARVNNVVQPVDGNCVGVVCTFSPRLGGGLGGRKMKIDVGDQFDDNPDETIGEVKDPSAEARRIAPPEFHYIG